MFYISKVTPLLFILAFFNLIVSIFLKINGFDYIYIGLVGVFGFISLTLIGALYQIVPNSQQEKLKYESLSFFVLGLGVIFSFFLWIHNLNLASITYLVMLILFLINIIPVVKNIKPITIRYLIVSILYFALSGVFFVLSSFNILPVQLAIHTMTVGVMINAVLGVQTAWFPLFFMQNLDFKNSIRIFYLVQISTLMVLGSFFLMNYRLIGFSSIFEIIAVFLFILQMVLIIKKGKMIQKIPYAVKLFSIGHLFLFLGLITAFLMSEFQKFGFFTIHLDFMIYGFALFTILGGVLHLTPRILWNMVSVKKAQEGKQVPQLNKLLNGKTVDKFSYFLVGVFGTSLILEIVFNSNIYWGIYLVGVLVTFIKFAFDFYKFYRI
jgi:hypothetical protein